MTNDTVSRLKELRDELVRSLAEEHPADRVVLHLSDEDRKRREQILAEVESQLGVLEEKR